MNPRAIIHGQQPYAGADAESCAVCGQACPPDSLPLGKVVSDNFTTWDLVAGDRTSTVCGGCVETFRDFRWRSTATLRSCGGDPVKMDGAAMRALIDAPPAVPFVLTFPATRKKHCWLNAGISDDTTLRIGGDDATIALAIADARRACASVAQLFEAGATKTEVNIGFYRPAVVQRLGHDLAAIDAPLISLRASGALAVIVWAVERPKSAGKGNQDMAVLSEIDELAAQLLARLANGSGQRDRDPIGFWGAGFVSRVQRRTSARSLLRFVEGVASDIDIRARNLRDAIDWLDGLTEAQQAAIVPAIKSSPRVLVAMAQDRAKQARPQRAATPRVSIPDGEMNDDLQDMFGDDA